MNKLRPGVEGAMRADMDDGPIVIPLLAEELGGQATRHHGPRRDRNHLP